MNTKALFGTIALVLATSGLALFGCSDDSGSAVGNQNPFTPGASSGVPGTSSSGGTSSGAASSSGGAQDCSKPVGCFCGTPTTQAEFLNRCTSAAALPVDLAVKPATVANVP